MNSYGKYKEFEIRDFTKITKFNGVDGFDTEDIDARETGRYDLVKWEDNDGKPYCFSIGELDWNADECAFDFKSCGVRYLEHGTEDLSQWLLKWMNLKSFELAKEE